VVWDTSIHSMLTKLIILLNGLASSAAAVLLAPVAWLPGWLSLTAIAGVTGVLMLLVFKYTSNQFAIRHTRSQIKANILALSLYRDSVAVGLRAQGRILYSAARLIYYSLVPMLLMIVPTVLLLGQISQWYEFRPLKINEEAVVTVQLASSETIAYYDLNLVNTPAIQTSVGPVRVPSKRLMCWNVAATEAGEHALIFQSPDHQYSKELVVGDGYRRTSARRPAEDWVELLLNPWESPFPEDSVVQSIEIAYPKRSSWLSGSTTWLPVWFVVSLIAAFAAKPILNVSI